MIRDDQKCKYTTMKFEETLTRVSGTGIHRTTNCLMGCKLCIHARTLSEL